MWRCLQKRSFCHFNQLESLKWKKNKVAMVIGFLGTKYKGQILTHCHDSISTSSFLHLGIQWNHSTEIPTIEREIENVLHSVGCISDDNHQSISKIGWSRSSRTDKGVHAARLLISAKLLLPPSYPDGIDSLIVEINKKLPEDIRLFSLVKVNQGFCARKSCNWRSLGHSLCFLTSLTFLFPLQRV
jgi:tRNA pseudouridine38-40 synthase